MNDAENLILQGLKIEIASLTVEMQKLAARLYVPASHDPLPEWVTLERAAELKGGAAFSTYRTRLFLQPCCGLNSRIIGGRKCWRREEVIRWIAITDADLKDYAAEWKVKIPANYERRAV